ncbi:MAG: family 20 glycosylhydrolase [Bacteroidales bacterium]|nr:family 20 glycosylhydrolase [Bacteroidales bacterium]
MHKSLFAAAVAVALPAVVASTSSCSHQSKATPVNVTWENLGHQVDTAGNPSYVQRFVITGDVGRVARLAFNQFDRPMQPTNAGDTVVKIIPGYYYIASSEWSADQDSLVMEIVTGGLCTSFSFAPDGVHGVDAQGQPFDVNFERKSLTARPEQWRVEGRRDRMPYADQIYDFNATLATDEPLGAYDILPSFKSVTLGEGTYTGEAKGETKIVENANPEWYSIIVAPEGITVEAANEATARMAWRTVGRLLAANGGSLPAATVVDYPDFGYRGLMIDVARNYQPLEEMKKFADVMADYRLNRLQFHFIDDEAWRLEIPGLPELTQYASKRGYTLDEAENLAQIYAGNGDANNPKGTANGYMTRQDFIDFLKYCNELGIQVIPEVETPGHARAARKAMEYRYRTTGDATYRLVEDNDTSKYRSAQDFGDNVMNPALPGPYAFMEKVIDEILAMYKEAGAPIEYFHIGGDEVPAGAWSGSPSAVKFMQENNIADEHGLHAYWADKMADMLNARGLKLAGWQEIAIDKPEDVARAIAPKIGFINLWVPWAQHGAKELPAQKAQRLGLPVLLSAVTNYYFDLMYDYSPDERGLNWGGVVDEFKSFDGYPNRLAPPVKGAPSKVIGVQGQLWAETMRSPEWLEYYLLPKMFGLVERGWNADSTMTHAKYNRIIDEREMPALDRKNVNYRMRQAGVKVNEDGKIVMNSPYPQAVIRYTLDGTDPTAESPVYEGPLSADGVKQVRARLYHHGKESVPSILIIEQ